MIRNCSNFFNRCITRVKFQPFNTFFAIFFFAAINFTNAQTAVEQYGQLRVQGNRIVDKNGSAVQLRGMSLYWSQWVGKYYNYNAIKWLRDDWKVNVVRAAMAVDAGGYLTNPTAEKNKVIAAVDAAISLGIYVVIDFHVHEANLYRSQAQTFFAEMAQRYGNSPNVLYEIWNEPMAVSWPDVIRPYHQAVVGTIRQYDSDNIIICGTGFWSQDVDIAASNPVSGSNIAYTLHFYANTHKQSLRDKAQTALNRGVALFVTEYGTTDASGDGYVNESETRTWWTFLDQNKISHANWSISDIAESSSALYSGASENGGWSVSQIKPSGQLVRNEIRAKNTTSSPGTTLANGTYKITIRHSGKTIDVSGASTADGANVVQWTYSGSSNQKWIIQNLGSDVYSIRAQHSGKSLDVTGYSTADGADINQWTYGGGNNQRWRIESVGSGYYRIVSVNSGKCIDISNNSTENGIGIQQWTCYGTNNQSFSFEQLSTATSRLVEQDLNQKITSQAIVYPNPTDNLFNISQAGSFQYSIKDRLGNIIEKGKATDKITTGNNLPSGIYILQIKSLQGNKEIKLIKQ